MNKSGLLVIISSPSGGGKDVVISALLKKFARSAKLITTTTRTPRKEDKNGITYYFTDKPTFEKKIENNETVEHNFYADNYYGIEKKELENKLKNFDVVFTNVDVNGRRHLNDAHYKNLSIFLVPGNLNDLKNRISRRGAVSVQELNDRMQTAQNEMAAANEYDFQIINETGKLSETIDSVAKIITNQLAKQA